MPCECIWRLAIDAPVAASGQTGSRPEWICASCANKKAMSGSTEIDAVQLASTIGHVVTQCHAAMLDRGYHATYMAQANIAAGDAHGQQPRAHRPGAPVH